MLRAKQQEQTPAPSVSLHEEGKAQYRGSVTWSEDVGRSAAEPGSQLEVFLPQDSVPNRQALLR